MVTINRALTNFTFSQANVTLVFAGGRFTGSGTITGNYTTFITEPVQTFDNGFSFAGTWKQEKIYAENFDTISSMNSNAAPAINKALQFSNVSGCRVKLLGKTYTITTPINILGNTTLEGTIMGPSYTSDSAVSKEGTVILASGTINAIYILTTGNTSSNTDCYRFVLNHLNIRHTGTGMGINIEAVSASGLIPRSGKISDIKISHTLSTGNYGIRVAGGSYIEFNHIFINGGKGVLLEGNYMQEFLWFNKVILNGVSLTSFEIQHGNHIYLTEVDTNDSNVGLMINNYSGGTYCIYVNRLNSTRCGVGIYVRADSDYLTRVYVSDSSIYQNTSKSPTAAINFDRTSASYLISECEFKNITIDTDGGVSSSFFSVKENNNCLLRCIFENIRTIRKTQLGPSNKSTFISAPQGGSFSATGNGSTTIFTTYICDVPYTPSPFPGNPIVVVNANLVSSSTPISIPFRVYTVNTLQAACTLNVVFATPPASGVFVIINYILTGYYT